MEVIVGRLSPADWIGRDTPAGGDHGGNGPEEGTRWSLTPPAKSYELAAVGDVLAMPDDVIWLWTLSNVLVVCVSTALTTKMATMAISASTKPYSTKDCPLFFVF